MNAELQRPHVDILRCNDTVVNIWASTTLRDDRNRVDLHLVPTYYVAGLETNHCYTWFNLRRNEKHSSGNGTNGTLLD